MVCFLLLVISLFSFFTTGTIAPPMLFYWKQAEGWSTVAQGVKGWGILLSKTHGSVKVMWWWRNSFKSKWFNETNSSSRSESLQRAIRPRLYFWFYVKKVTHNIIKLHLNMHALQRRKSDCLTMYFQIILFVLFSSSIDCHTGVSAGVTDLGADQRQDSATR